MSPAKDMTLHFLSILADGKMVNISGIIWNGRLPFCTCSPRNAQGSQAVLMIQCEIELLARLSCHHVRNDLIRFGVRGDHGFLLQAKSVCAFLGVHGSRPNFVRDSDHQHLHLSGRGCAQQFTCLKKAKRYTQSPKDISTGSGRACGSCRKHCSQQRENEIGPLI